MSTVNNWAKNHTEPPEHPGEFTANGTVAWDRAATDPCERGTIGCSVMHSVSGLASCCEKW